MILVFVFETVSEIGAETERTLFSFFGKSTAPSVPVITAIASFIVIILFITAAVVAISVVVTVIVAVAASARERLPRNG